MIEFIKKKFIIIIIIENKKDQIVHNKSWVLQVVFRAN